MKLFKTIAVACAALIATPAAVCAADYNMVGVSYTNTTLSPEYGSNMSMNGFSVGYTHGFGISASHPMFIEAGLKFQGVFNSKAFGFDFDSDSDYFSDDDIDSKSSLCSFVVPVSFAWKFAINDKISIKPYAGINLKVHVLGKTTLSAFDEKMSADWFDKEEMGVKFNRAQVGWHIGTTFEYSRIFLGVSYGTDFNQIAKSTGSGTFDLALGYCF